MKPWSMKALEFFVVLVVSMLRLSTAFLTDHNECQMTMMWRYPNFVDVGMDWDATCSRSIYSLVLYGEGLYAQYYRQTKVVNGIPVIFVPGNAGSSKQARSLGSVLQNKTESRGTKFHFDVFAVDFDEQHSGMSSDMILEQADFLEAAMGHVREMYVEPRPPIVLVGHSMGGIVIREVLSRRSFDASIVSAVFTLATPHVYPPVIFDSGMVLLWDKLNNLADKKAEGLPPILSISGGLKDELISERITLTPSAKTGIWHFSSTAIDRVWAEADHQCIVWCNQLVRHLSRVLFYYAKNQSGFRSNFDEKVVEKFYHGSAADFKSVNLPEDSELPVCSVDDGCEDRDKVVVSAKGSDLILAVGPVAESELLSATLQNQACSPVTRYLTTKALYSLLNTTQCQEEIFVGDSRVSKIYVFSPQRTLLSPMKLTDFRLLLPVVQTRKFTVRGYRRLPVSFEDINPSTVFAVTIRRKCVTKIAARAPFRAIYEAPGIRRLDSGGINESSTRRFIRIFAYDKNAEASLTFIDGGDCNITVTVSHDWMHTARMTMLDWITVFPLFVFILVFLLQAMAIVFDSELAKGFLTFGILLLTVFFASTITFLAFLVALILANAVHCASDMVQFVFHRLAQRWHSILRPPSSTKPIYLITCIFASILIADRWHPFFGVVTALGLAVGLKRRPVRAAAPFGILYVFYLSLTAITYVVDRFACPKRDPAFLVVSAAIYIISLFAGDFQLIRRSVFVLSIGYLSALSFLLGRNPPLGVFIHAIDVQAAFVSIAYALFVTKFR